MPRVTVDFWDVLDDQNHASDLLSVIEAAARIPLAGRIKDRSATYMDILQEVEHRQGEGWGLIVRARKENVPGLVNTRTGKGGKLPLGPNETVGEQMNFLYDSVLQVLVTQRTPIARSTALEYLLFDLTKMDFHLQPKLRKDAWDRLGRMESIGRIDVKINGPRHHPDFSAEIPSLNKMLDEAGENAMADSVELILSSDQRRNNHLNTGLVHRMLTALRGDGAEVKKLSVRGRDRDTGRSEVVDFIRDRLVHTGEVEYDGGQIGGEQCRRLLRLGIEQNRAYLKTLL